MRADDVGILIKLICDSISVYGNSQLKEAGLTLTQFRVLSFIYEQESGATSKQIEETFHVSQPTVAGIFKRLEGKGLIWLKTDDMDHRVKYARITKAGTDSLQHSMHQTDDMESQLMQKLTADEVKELRRLLTLVYEGIT